VCRGRGDELFNLPRLERSTPHACSDKRRGGKMLYFTRGNFHASGFDFFFFRLRSGSFLSRLRFPAGASSTSGPPFG
jgi:hypothetical protein